MLLRRAFLGLGLALLITTACHTAVGQETKKPVTRVLIQKKEHRMKLLAADGMEVASYSVAIGPGGMGPKRKEGDMTTPVGRYHITMHQPSQYKIFLRLDYPTADDFKRFNA
jgi:murein L,D-transpeptidase YafK